jgi:hypothetical protein
MDNCEGTRGRDIQRLRLRSEYLGAVIEKVVEEIYGFHYRIMEL